jgi:small ligand-binding sensory domain FIST
MTGFSTAVTTALSPADAAAELARPCEEAFGDAGGLTGGVLLATAAAGKQAAEVGRLLGLRWPTAALSGSSFEGIIENGRIWRDRPALVLIGWSEGPDEPLALCLDPREQDVHRIAHEILESAGRARLEPSDVVILFPDAVDSPGLDRILADLGPLLGAPSIAGAAATGIDGHPALTWAGDQDVPGAMLAVVMPGGAPDGGAIGLPRVRSAGASRAASPWLEITACRSRWIDGLEGEPPVDWIRRQLAIEDTRPVEAVFDRLLVRLCRRASWERQHATAEGVRSYEERYVVGLDPRKGSISVAGAFERGDQAAFALPDPERARHSLRKAIDEMPVTPLLLQLACRTRDATLHGDADLEGAWVAHHASGRQVVGVVAPFQLGTDPSGVCQTLVHTTVLAALGPPRFGSGRPVRVEAAREKID